MEIKQRRENFLQFYSEKKKYLQENRWLGSRGRNSRQRKSLIFLNVLLYSLTKYLVPGLLTAAALFGKGFKGNDTSHWSLLDPGCISILDPAQPGHRQRGMLISAVPLLLFPPPLLSSPTVPIAVMDGLDLPSRDADDPGQFLPLLINCQIIFGTSTYAFLEVQFSAGIIY